ncbi:hypothetical protein SEA_DARTHPHADER_60 [Mycobacterium phage DarthPhader]|uniref:Uncharacterized protein n=1 Tax=Mycobacterium phage DarthPhader TaxID=1912975 RepID=A0A1I9S406_9CAUD|nr:hypothetical protein KIV60_gp41 [Mycobacterium phage DarthPhader]AOZ61300.1 hypothetical protein SEA_DARTHPHADER_60 [Mycobacterium phage DarthPhader]
MSVLMAFLWMFGWFFIALTALAWCIDVLERRKEKRGNTPATGQAESPEAVR